jgi:predicted transcriptional regulator
LVRKKGEKSYSRQDTILQILLYLYNKQGGKSPTDIQLHCSNHTLAYEYVKKILDELYKKRVIDREKSSDHRDIYIINDKALLPAVFS